MDAIVAVYADWGIGADGTQPVTLRADRRRFRELTEGAAVIVGRKTLADFPGGKPLKNRRNIVLSRITVEIPGAEIARSAAEAVEYGQESGRCYVIGGAAVYHSMMPYIDRVFVTKLDARPFSDSFFPDLDDDPDWRLTDAGEALEEDGIGYRFCVYERA